MTEGTDMTHDIENVARANCRGSWQLGTACGKCPRCDATRPAIAAMQQAQQEPDAWLYTDRANGRRMVSLDLLNIPACTETPLYAHPPVTIPTPPAGGSDAAN